MAHFVDGFGNKVSGYPKINLDLVSKLVPIQNGNGWRCLNANGEEIGRIATYAPDLKTPAVIPNYTSTTLIQFWDGDACHYQRYNILAWQIVDGGMVSPIICEGDPETMIYCYEERVGDHTTYIFPDDTSFDEFAQAQEHARAELKERSARRQNAPSPVTPIASAEVQ